MFGSKMIKTLHTSRYMDLWEKNQGKTIFRISFDGTLQRSWVHPSGNVCSAQPAWPVDALFTVRKFRKTDRNPKNKRVALSHISDICIVCENTRAQSAVGKRFIFCDPFTCKKKSTVWNPFIGKRNSETMRSNPVHLQFTVISQSRFLEAPPPEKQADSPCLLSPRLSGCKTAWESFFKWTYFYLKPQVGLFIYLSVS